MSFPLADPSQMLSVYESLAPTVARLGLPLLLLAQERPCRKDPAAGMLHGAEGDPIPAPGLGFPWGPRGGFGAGRAEDQFRWLESSAGATLGLQAPHFTWLGFLPILTLLLWHFSERDQNSKLSAQMMPFLQGTLCDSENCGFLQRDI